MAASYRQQARVRKWTYWILIVALFTVLVAYRQLRVVENAAERYNIAETNIGEVDLGGSAARFALACFRGPLITMLWWEAIELQAKHDWSEMELRIKALTKLQPHFREPWQYQGWNLAFNVSVEFDSVYHKYFHVAQGINWVANGERKNRRLVYDPASPSGRREVGDPDLRWSTGWFLYDKMTVADETPYFRIFQALSCIEPQEWDPYVLRQNPGRLEQFKRNYPRLVRRVQELRSIPEGATSQLDAELVRFLTTCRRPDFPSLYPEQLNTQTGVAARLADVGREKFPIWPDVDRYNPSDKHREEVHDPYEIARNWYEFSLEPLPPPGTYLYNLDPKERIFYKGPQRMVSIIFRGNPARAKSHQAKALAKEGWLGESLQSWKEAERMWNDFGYANGLKLKDFAKLQETAARFRAEYPEYAQQGEIPAYRHDDRELMRGFIAFRQEQQMQRDRGMANYNYWEVSSEYNAKPEALEARRHWYNASRRLRSDLRAASAEYARGVPYWKKLLATPRALNPDVDLPFLLDIGPQPGLISAMLFQPERLLLPTPYALEILVQEEVFETQEQYRKQLAKSEAAPLLIEATTIWEAVQTAGRQASAPAALVGAAAAFPIGMAPTTVEWVENVLGELPGPLDPYLSRNLILAKRAKEERRMPSPAMADEMKMTGGAVAAPPPR